MLKKILKVKIEKVRPEIFLKRFKTHLYLLFKISISLLIFRQLICLVNNSKIKSLPREINKVNAKVNACFFVLSRNKDLNDLIKTIEQIENAFNHNYNYPYVIVSDKKFTNYFKKQIKKQTNSLVQFGLIPKGVNIY